MDRQGDLAVIDLLNDYYCRRITWFAYVLGIRQRSTDKTLHGRNRHSLWVDRESNRWKEGASIRAQRKITAVDLHSEALGLRGRTDAAVLDKGVRVPYEVKSTPPPDHPWPGQVLQMAAYALLLEEADRTAVDHGYLHYLDGDIVREHAVTPDAKALVHRVLGQVRETIESEAMPNRAPPARCRDCVYRKICV